MFEKEEQNKDKDDDDEDEESKLEIKLISVSTFYYLVCDVTKVLSRHCYLKYILKPIVRLFKLQSSLVEFCMRTATMANV